MLSNYSMTCVQETKFGDSTIFPISSSTSTRASSTRSSWMTQLAAASTNERKEQWSAHGASL
ncbi:hypothetical protein Pcac1_g21624 [Phytophthora cactorum]|nr:hypothetical protein Pcac1_g21624 [Phytophthora cactorum]